MVNLCGLFFAFFLKKEIILFSLTETADTPNAIQIVKTNCIRMQRNSSNDTEMALAFLIIFILRRTMFCLGHWSHKRTLHTAHNKFMTNYSYFLPVVILSAKSNNKCLKIIFSTIKMTKSTWHLCFSVFFQQFQSKIVFFFYWLVIIFHRHLLLLYVLLDEKARRHFLSRFHFISKQLF